MTKYFYKKPCHRICYSLYVGTSIIKELINDNAEEIIHLTTINTISPINFIDCQLYMTALNCSRHPHVSVIVNLQNTFNTIVIEQFNTTHLLLRHMVLVYITKMSDMVKCEWDKMVYGKIYQIL